MRRIPIGLAIALVVLEGAVTACMPPPPVPPTPAPSQQGKVLVRVGTGDSDSGLVPHREIIAQFEQANPDIEVQLISLAGNDYYDRLLAQIADGSAPDLLQIGDDAVPLFVQNHALENLDPYVQGRYPLDPGIYLPGVFQPGAWQGRQYLLPKDLSPLAVYYNKRLFDQLQVSYPKAGWTWNDMLETAQSLTRDTDGDGTTDIWGLQLPAGWTSGFEYWVAAAGGSLISEDGKTFQGYMDSPATVAALQFYADLYHKHKVAPPPATIGLFAGGNNDFETGKAAMQLFGHWPESRFKTNPLIDLGVVGAPIGKRQANVLFWGGFGIYSGSKNKEAAWRLLRFYAGAEGARVWRNWGLPSVRSVAESSGMVQDPIEGVWLQELTHLVPRAFVFTPHWADTADPALRKALEQAVTDPSANVAELLRQAAAQAQAALDSKK